MSYLISRTPYAVLACAVVLYASVCCAEHPADSNPDSRSRPTLAQLKRAGQQQSRFRNRSAESAPAKVDSAKFVRPEPDLRTFESNVKPLLQQHCLDCHNADTTEGNIRIDTLDPDLLSGEDTDWWSEIFAVITKGEMPPPDASELTESDRQQLVDWLSSELKTASIVRRRSGKHSTFRRMTRYEYNYALQDLLGLPWDFAKDLPPEPHSEDGFQNSSELLHLSVSQFQTYHRIARTALRRATAMGEKPQVRYWSIPIDRAAKREWARQDQQIEKLKQELDDDQEQLTFEIHQLNRKFRQPVSGVHFKDLSSDRVAAAQWRYYGARYAFAPQDQPTAMPDATNSVAILPSGSRQRLIFELGNQVPDDGTMRVTVRASRIDTQSDAYPSLQLYFGWQASNEGRALIRVSDDDAPITADQENPQIVHWDVPLGEIYPRNSVRKTSRMGAMPSPSEYIRVVNSSATDTAVQIDYVEVTAPVYDQWPPASHQRIFNAVRPDADEITNAKNIITRFMRRAWRRSLTEEELDQKLDLFAAMRPRCKTFEEAIVEVLATVISSPQFLYVAADNGNVHPDPTNEIDPHAIASRLALFLWCSVPDEKLLALAESGDLAQKDVLSSQVQRMLDDPRSDRFAEHFVAQWLDLQLLEFQNFKQHVKGFDPLLKQAMQREPVAMFSDMLRRDASVLDFLHCDYAMVNERLARHYGISGVFGNHFRRVPLDDGFQRGGLLTQAGLLAMNSDYPDSHPLKRAIWLLESILDDPPPPPPPAVPQIDLADPEIAKMTLKERIEDHRNQAACLSCHIKIDPWGIAFENYDALGRWRDKIDGKPVDASSELFNRQTLDGMDGLKRFLLQNRQDQFVRAMVSKLTTYALGRPLSFSDRAEVDAITARVRRGGDGQMKDGLRSAIDAIVQSDLFQNQ